MNELEILKSRGAVLTLEELVERANALLPQVLPEGDSLRQSELNPRLVRHLATLGLIDEAGREGREARYSARHLLQLLVVRRLMAEGHTTGAIKKLTFGASDGELEGLLHGGVQIQREITILAPLEEPPPSEGTNAALEFLGRVKARGVGIAAPSLAAPSFSLEPSDENWRRIALGNGLELHIREDFRAPTTPLEREKLLRRIEDELKKWLKSPLKTQRRKT